jgi:hypothetical protein
MDKPWMMIIIILFTIQIVFDAVRFQVLTAASMMFRIVIPDDGGSTYPLNVGRQLFYTAVHPRR